MTVVSNENMAHHKPPEPPRRRETKPLMMPGLAFVATLATLALIGFVVWLSVTPF